MTPTVDATPGDRQAPSPPTRRVVQVIDLLSRHPEQALTLAEIVRRTGLSRATAHAVMSQLVLDGWAARGGEGYRLGRGLVSIARRAESSFPLRRIASEALRGLAADLSLPTFLAERDGGTIEITEVIDTPPADWIHPGRRLPFRPPVCREYAAWLPAAQQQDWIAQAPEATQDRLRSALVAVHARGYAVERLAQDSGKMLDIIGSLRDSPAADSVRNQLGSLLAELISIDYLPDELAGADPFSAATVAAPIIDGGQVVASLVACPDAQLSGDELRRIGAATVAAAGSVTELLAAP